MQFCAKMDGLGKISWDCSNKCSLCILNIMNRDKYNM